MAGRLHPPMTELAALEAEYRKSRWTIIGHGVFFFVCCAVAVIVRIRMNMPPALLTVVFFVALILFGGDLLRFLSCRRRLGKLRAELMR